MKKGKVFKKIGTMFLAAVLALAPAATVSAGNNNLPEADHAGSITVHKYLRDIASSTVGTSLPLTQEEEAALGTPGAGIDFSLYKVKEGYEVTNTTKVVDALANADYLSTKTTNEYGIIKWEWANNATGYYVLVEETVKEGYQPAPSAIIALPYAVDDDEWNYNIHVYPKNISDKELVKDVVDKEDGYSVGDIVEWKYTSQVNIAKLYDNSTGTEIYGTYKITDVLDPRLDFVQTTGMTGIGGSSNVTLTPGDYSVDTSTSGTVVWNLSEAGIKKLASVNATAIELTFETEITDAAYAGSSSADIKNGGTLEWTNHAGDESKEYTIPDPEKPYVTLYNIVIKKTNNDGSKLLDGAVFKIATSKENAEAGRFIQTDTGEDVTVTTGPHPTDETITGGWAMFAGLPVDTDNDTTFWLVEDVAPTTQDGKYVRPGEPIEVTILNDSGTGAQKVTTSVTIKNYLPDDPDIPEKWKLPLTGGMGTLIFYVIGAIVMIGSVLWFMKSKRTKTIH